MFEKKSMKISLVIFIIFNIYTFIRMTIDYGIGMGLYLLGIFVLIVIPMAYFILYKKVWWVKMFIIYSIIVIIIAIVAVAISVIVNPSAWVKH